MLSDQRGEIESDRQAVDNPPFACDHHPIGAVRAAENQRRERIVRAREARLVELEQSKIRLITVRNFADVGTPKAARRASVAQRNTSRCVTLSAP